MFFDEQSESLVKILNENHNEKAGLNENNNIISTDNDNNLHHYNEQGISNQLLSNEGNLFLIYLLLFSIESFSFVCKILYFE